jgi:hypothetical protein
MTSILGHSIGFLDEVKQEIFGISSGKNTQKTAFVPAGSALDFAPKVTIVTLPMLSVIVHEIQVGSASPAAGVLSGRGLIAVRQKLHDPPRLR